MRVSSGTGSRRAAFERSLTRARELESRLLEGQALGSLAGVEDHEGSQEGALALALQSAGIAHETGFTWWATNMLGLAAECALTLGRVAEAEEHARASLALGHGINYRLHRVWALALLARIATIRADTGRAGRPWGAMEAEEVRGLLPTSWDEERERYAESVFADAGADFEDARAVGRRLSLDEAVEYALA